MKLLENGLENIIFQSRWLLAPFYLGLVLSIVLLFVKFVQYMAVMVINIADSKMTDVIVQILALVDMSLVASLLLMIIFSGYEIFVSKIDVAGHEDRPDWMGKVDFSGLKLKVIGAIVAISAIDLLKTFMDISENIKDGSDDVIMWKVIVHMAFVLSGVLFAVMDKIAGETKKH